MARTPIPRPFAGADARDFPDLTGCDEAGRGALCGPVVAAAVWFAPRAFPPALLAALDDSKRLSARERERLRIEIERHARVAVAAASAAEIDRTDVRAATLHAMRRAVLRLGLPARVCVDGRDVPPLPYPAEPVVRGDRTVPQIAAASIIAKTYRDHLMARLARRYPAYGWERNAGYGTAEHLAALAAVGVTRHHRVTFRPVAELCGGWGK